MPENIRTKQKRGLAGPLDKQGKLSDNSGVAVVQEGRERGMNIYLLNIGELIQEDAGFRADSMLHKVDEVRREKVLAAKTAQGKAAELGAGLLLQMAVQDWERDKPEDRPGESGETARGIVLPKRFPYIRSCTVSHILSGLAEPLPLSYCYGDKGKPYFENIPLFFNISHSGEYVLCAVSSREVGADIQKIQPANVMKLARRFFSEPEYRALECCGSDREQQGLFFGLWSRKEAYGKLTGDGIAVVLGQNMQNADAKRDVEWMDVSPPAGYAMAVCRTRHLCQDRHLDVPKRHQIRIVTVKQRSEDEHGTVDEVSEGL